MGAFRVYFTAVFNNQNDQSLKQGKKHCTFQKVASPSSPLCRFCRKLMFQGEHKINVRDL